jgi:uncharacterized protein with GYD domain
MPVYVMLSRLTDEGARTIKHNPDRITEVDAELEAMGVKVLQQYAVLGEYDFVNIVEAPDNMTITKASLEMGSRGSVRITTLPAIEAADLIAAHK